MQSLAIYSKDMYDILNNRRTISNATISNAEFKKGLEFIDNINSLGCMEDSFNGRPLDKIEVPKVFSGLFAPAGVFIAPVEYKLHNDLMSRSDRKSEDSLSYFGFEEWILKVIGMRRATNVEYVKLSDVRVIASLSDVYSRVINDGKVHGDVDSTKMPLNINCKDLSKSMYYNTDVKDQILETWRNIVMAI